MGCGGIKSITIPNTVTNIESYAFENCAAEIIWEANPTIKIFASQVFAGYKGTKLTIPRSVDTIIHRAFANCAAEIVWEDNPAITTFDFNAFEDYLGKKLIIPRGVKEINPEAFKNCTAEIVWEDNPSITKLILSFVGYKGANITIPDSVTFINQAFKDCVNLKSIIIPESVDEVICDTFLGCDKDLIIYCRRTSKTPRWMENWDLVKKGLLKKRATVVWGYKD